MSLLACIIYFPVLKFFLVLVISLSKLSFAVMRTSSLLCGMKSRILVNLKMPGIATCGPSSFCCGLIVCHGAEKLQDAQSLRLHWKCFLKL